MLTADQISKVLSILNIVADCPYANLQDPAFLGKLRAEAFLVGLPLQRALEKVEVKVQEPAPACIEE